MPDFPWDQNLSDQADALDVARRLGGLELDRRPTTGFTPRPEIRIDVKPVSRPKKGRS